MSLRRAGMAVSMLCPLFFFFVLIIPSLVRAGGGWVHEPNKYYIESSFGYYQAGKSFDEDGNRQELKLLRDPSVPSSALSGLVPSTYRQYEGNLYFEYGLPSNLEVVGMFALYRVAEQDSEIGTFKANGIGDAVLGLKYKWFERPWIVSALQFDLGIPSGDEKASGDVSGQASQPIPLGDGEYDFALRAFASKSFYPIPAYLSADMGFHYRQEGFFNDIPWSLEGGYTFTLSEDWFPKLVTILSFRGLISTNTESGTGFGSSAVTGNSPGQEFIDVQPSVSLGIIKGLSWFNSYAYTLAGTNTGAGWNIRSGLSWEN